MTSTSFFSSDSADLREISHISDDLVWIIKIDADELHSNPDAVTKIVTALNVRVTPRDVRSKDTRNLLTLIMQQWLPLSTATFQAIVDIIPPPDTAQSQRMPFMLHPDTAVASSTPLKATNHLEEGLYGCDRSDEAEVVAYVSKMFAVARGDLPEFKKKEMTADEMRRRGREERERRAAMSTTAVNTAAEGATNGVESTHNTTNGIPLDNIGGLTQPLKALEIDDSTSSTQHGDASKVDRDLAAESSEVLLAFSRIFSGTLRRNSTLLATLPKYSPDLPADHPRNRRFVKKVEVGEVYMMMGRELIAVEQVSAGQVCALGGLEGIVHRNATLWAPDAAGVTDDSKIGKLANLAGIITQVGGP